MNETNKLERYITLGWKGLLGTDILAYSIHSEVTKKIKCCEYSPRGRIYNTLYFA